MVWRFGEDDVIRSTTQTLQETTTDHGGKEMGIVASEYNTRYENMLRCGELGLVAKGKG